LMAGTRLQQSSSISQLTSQPETIPSCYRRSRHAEFQPLSGRQHISGTEQCIKNTTYVPPGPAAGPHKEQKHKGGATKQ
jgi:hypothetical protein